MASGGSRPVSARSRSNSMYHPTHSCVCHRRRCCMYSHLRNPHRRTQRYKSHNRNRTAMPSFRTPCTRRRCGRTESIARLRPRRTGRRKAGSREEPWRNSLRGSALVQCRVRCVSWTVHNTSSLEIIGSGVLWRGVEFSEYYSARALVFFIKKRATSLVIKTSFNGLCAASPLIEPL